MMKQYMCSYLAAKIGDLNTVQRVNKLNFTPVG